MASRRNRHPKRSIGSSQQEGPIGKQSDVSVIGGEPHSFAVLLGAVCVVALLLRLINVLKTVEIPTVVFLLGDARGYFDWATRIAGGEWYGTETFYQAPLYPYTLAVLIKSGCGVLGIRLVQAMLGAVSVALLGIAGKNIFHPTVGLVAAAMYAVYPAAIYYDGIIQKTSLASFLLCALLGVCGLLAQRNLRSLSVAIGVILGLLVLTRENALLWVPILPLWIWLGIPQTRKARLVLVACYTLGLSLVLLPVAARNASLGGEWSPTTFQAGPNFYIGNNLESNGIYRPLVPGHETPMFERADAQRLAEQAEGRELSSREVSKFWANRSLQEIRQDPGRWLQLMIAKSFMVINRFEVPDTESLQVYCDYSWPLRMLGPGWHFGILCPLAVWGIVVTRRQWRSLWLYYLLIVVMAAAIVMFFILGRYRQPLVPLLTLFAAMALHDVWCRVRAKDLNAIRAPVVATVIAAIACNITVHEESTLNAASYMNLGLAATQAGDLGTGIKVLSRSIQAHPEIAEAHLNLGIALERSNRPLEAIICFENALKIEPSLSMADALLGGSYERIGDQEKSLQHYRRAIQIDPGDDRSRQAIERLVRSDR